MTVIKGGVILVGSLFWEGPSNCIEGEESKAKKREQWRENSLIMSEAVSVFVPIRYGRSSSTRSCTYTIVFSREYLGEKGSGKAIPFSNEINSFDDFLNEVRSLAQVEVLAKEGKDIFAKDWGCIAIWINPDSPQSSVISDYWNQIIIPKYGYRRAANEYSWCDGKLIDDNSKLTVEINSTFDYLLCSYIKPKHKNLIKNRESQYPDSQEIAEEIISSGYKIYFTSNIKNGIKTVDDENILSYLKD